MDVLKPPPIRISFEPAKLAGRIPRNSTGSSRGVTTAVRVATKKIGRSGIDCFTSSRGANGEARWRSRRKRGRMEGMVRKEEGRWRKLKRKRKKSRDRKLKRKRKVGQRGN